MSAFIPGQRWISESEPELGLGTVVASDSGRVKVEFKAAGETRIYAADQAPLKRVRFRAGDKIKTQANQEFIVKEVAERHGLLIYVGENQQLPETEVSDRVSLQGPQERLFAGRFDPPGKFTLRRRSLELLHRSRKSPVRGFVGGRIDLIPHQLYIAQEVANRHAPRVLLSDEVGLGKTIEACLILHRLLLSGRANRILMLVLADLDPGNAEARAAHLEDQLDMGLPCHSSRVVEARQQDYDPPEHYRELSGFFATAQYSAKRFRSVPKIDCTLAKSFALAASSAASISRRAGFSIA